MRFAAVVTVAATFVALAIAPVGAPTSVFAAAPIATVPLGSAATFAVLTIATVGNTATGPATTLRGDLGAGSGTTGFPPGLYTGALYTGLAVNPALADLTIAYDNAKGRPAGLPLAGDLLDVTVGPGVHTSIGAVANTGTFTIDAGGVPNAVFIFQIGGALSMAAGSHVVLAGQAKASNVFWVVTGAGAVGADALFAGTLMASAAIGVGANTIFNGRALAQTGAITVNSNEFYSSSPTVSISPDTTAYTTDTSPTITGITSVRSPSTVTVTVHGETLSATPAADGSWSATPAGLLANAIYTVTASVVDGAGNTGAFSQELTVDTIPPVVTIDGGASIVTNNTATTLTGTTDVAAGQTVTVTMTRTTPALTLSRTTLVQTDGTWNITPNGFTAGQWTTTAMVTDPAGNQSSATQAVTIDMTAPVATITGGASALTNDSTPTIIGTSEAGAVVTVSVDGGALTGVSSVGVDWSVTYTGIPLGLGAHNVAMTARDPAGNITSHTQTLTVDAPPSGSSSSGFTSIGPKRVFDTRAGQSANALRAVAKAQVAGSYELQVQMTALAGYVPASGVGAVSLNVTSTGSAVDGFITVYACGSRELVSSVNFVAGKTVANAVVTPLSGSGTVCFFSNTPTDIIVDINGWFATGATFTSVGPKRVFDTRPGNSPDALRTAPDIVIAANGMLEVVVTPLTGYVPAIGVGSVSLNVTVTNPQAVGFITVYSCGTRALVSSVNFVAGQTVANAVIAAVSPAGTVCFYSSAATDLVVDINGWFQTGSGFNAIDPARVLDTRPGNSPDALRDVSKAKIGGARVLEVQVTDMAGRIPADGVTAVSLNVTVTNPDGDGFVTVYACNVLDEVSSLNYAAGRTVANAVLARVSASGTICLYSNVTTDVIVDINGWTAAS